MRDPDWNALLGDAGRRARDYRNGLPRRRVSPEPAAIAALDQLDHPLPDAPTDPAEVLATLDRFGSPATVASAGPRFFGFVIGGSLPAALAANWLASAWDQNTGLFVATPIATVLEEVAQRWLLDILRLPAGAGVAFVTGATMANFTALASARQKVLHDAGWDVEAQGLFGAPPIAVVISAEAHPSVRNALHLLGLGRERVHTMPVDSQGRMIASALPEVASPAIVCLQAGNVNTGAFDPAPAICEWATRRGAWVHVDAAFGLWAAAAPELVHLVDGVAAADSWATDAHKWLNVPYDSGLAFVRDPEHLRAAMSVEAAYLPQGEHREPSQYVPELSRRARGVDVWAALLSLGREGIAELITRNCRQARRFAEVLAAAGYKVLNEVVLNQVLVSFGSPERTNEVIRAIQQEGTCWCGGTQWQGQIAMRISVSNWSTTDQDVEESLAAILNAAKAA